MITLVYKRLLQIGKVAGSLSFLFGVPYGVYEYMENQTAKRIDQTLDFYKSFNSAPFTGYRAGITTALAKNRDAIAQAAVSAESLERTVVAMVEGTELEKDLLLIMDFYDGLVVCVLKGLCDPDTTERLFATRAFEIYTTFYPYIQRMRTTTAAREFGIGMQTIATTRRARPRGA